MSYARKVVQRLPGGRQRVVYQQMGDDSSGLTADSTVGTTVTAPAGSTFTCPDGTVVSPGTACPTVTVPTISSVPPTPGLPWCSQAKVGQACNPDTAAQASAMTSLTNSLFGQTGILGTLTSPLALAGMLAGYLIITNNGAVKKPKTKR